MRTLVTTYPGASHFLPLVPFCWALRAAGHDVLVHTDEEFGDRVAAQGLSVVTGPPVPVDAMFRERFAPLLAAAAALPARWPTTPDGIEASGARAGLEAGLEHFADVAEVLLPSALEHARRWEPDAVVFDPASFVGPCVAAARGVPGARHLWGPDFMFWLPGRPGPVDDRLGALVGTGPVAPAGDLTLDPCPPSLQVPAAGPRISMRTVPHNGGAVLPPWLSRPAGRLRIGITWGGWLDGTGAASLYRVPEILEALGEGEEEIVVTATRPQRELLEQRASPLPARVRIVDPVPLTALVPTLDLLVHQGGSGTLLTAAALGVPQTVVPQVPDQLLNAGAAADAGIASCLPPGSPPGLVAEAVRADLADPARARRAREVAAENAAQPSPAAGVEAFVRHTADRPAPAGSFEEALA